MPCIIKGPWSLVFYRSQTSQNTWISNVKIAFQKHFQLCKSIVSPLAQYTIKYPWNHRILGIAAADLYSLGGRVLLFSAFWPCWLWRNCMTSGDLISSWNKIMYAIKCHNYYSCLSMYFVQNAQMLTYSTMPFNKKLLQIYPQSNCNTESLDHWKMFFPCITKTLMTAISFSGVVNTTGDWSFHKQSKSA